MINTNSKELCKFTYEYRHSVHCYSNIVSLIKTGRKKFARNVRVMVKHEMYIKFCLDSPWNNLLGRPQCIYGRRRLKLVLQK
jgi:hypothetical protein